MTSSQRDFRILWWTTGLAVLYLSVVTVLGASSLHPRLVGSIEALGAALFLVPRTLRIGAALLLLSFALAIVIHGLQHQLAVPIFIYAAVVWYVQASGKGR